MNTNNYILDAQGRQLFSIGGPHAWRIHDAGEYIASMEWVDGEPAMILVAKSRMGFAYAICLSSIGMYALPNGKPNPEGVEDLAKSLPDFGKALERAELHRLVDIVLRYTSELIAMPPTPREVQLADASRPLWEVTHVDPQTERAIKEVTI